MATTEMEMSKGAGAAMLERVVLGGDLSKLSAQERMLYYRELCQSLKLNPLTQPFQYLSLSGKLVLYARKDATEQLRKQHGVSITKLDAQTTEGVYIVTATAKDQSGREDVATGAVAIENLRGEAKANAMLKAETKAKRRVTLSLCGLGMLDETEVESIPGAQVVELDPAISTPGTGTDAAETVEQEGDRLFKTPEEEEREEKLALLESVAKGFQACKLAPKEQEAKWLKHSGGQGPVMDPDSIGLDALHLLLDELRALHAAQKSRK